MKTDNNLHFLQDCSNEDLKTLCDILTHNNSGKVRFNESITKSDAYRSCYPDNMRMMWEELASEIQNCGGNTILNVVRKGGPSYKSIVLDVCKKMKVKDVSASDKVEKMEQKLVFALVNMAVDELSEDQIREIMVESHLEGYELSKKGLLGALVAVQVINPFLYAEIVGTVMMLVSRMIFGRGMMFVGYRVLGRSFGSLLGPLGWVLLTGWATWDMMGPAYRVTVPAVIQIALMRMKQQPEACC